MNMMKSVVYSRMFNRVKVIWIEYITEIVLIQCCSFSNFVKCENVNNSYFYSSTVEGTSHIKKRLAVSQFGYFSNFVHLLVVDCVHYSMYSLCSVYISARWCCLKSHTAVIMTLLHVTLTYILDYIAEHYTKYISWTLCTFINKP